MADGKSHYAVLAGVRPPERPLDNRIELRHHMQQWRLVLLRTPGGGGDVPRIQAAEVSFDPSVHEPGYLGGSMGPKPFHKGMVRRALGMRSSEALDLRRNEMLDRAGARADGLNGESLSHRLYLEVSPPV
jgi:hypothetical protein